MLKYSTDRSVKFLVDKLEWIIVPVVNVDGYIYSHTTVMLAPGDPGTGSGRSDRGVGSGRCVVFLVIMFDW